MRQRQLFASIIVVVVVVVATATVSCGTAAICIADNAFVRF